MTVGAAAELDPAVEQRLLAAMREGFPRMVEPILLGLVRQVARDAVAEMARARQRGKPVRPERLTPREHEWLQALADGFTAEEIARDMGVAEATVNYYSKTVVSKMGAVNRAHAVAVAMRMNLIV